MNDILLSIIIPMHNSEDYVEKSLYNCIEQNIDFKLYEILIIDDGSTDNSASIVNKFIDNHKSHIIQLLKNDGQGVSSARNTGIKYASGKYIWFVDSDDYITPNILDRITNEVIHEKLDLLMMDYYSENSFCTKSISTIKGSNDSIYNGYSFLLSQYNSFYCMVWLFVIKKEILIENDITFNCNFYHEDLLFTPILIYYSQRIKHINLYAYNYIVHENSLSNNINTIKTRLTDYINVANEIAIFEKEMLTSRLIKSWFKTYENEIIINSFRICLRNLDKNAFITLYYFSKNMKIIPLKYYGSYKRICIIFILNHYMYIPYKLYKYIFK